MQIFLDALSRALAATPNDEALVCDGRRFTFAEFADRLQRLHGLLTDLGLAKGDRVAIISFNSAEMVELYCGVPMAGMVQVPLNFRWTEHELRYALEDAEARVLVCDRDPGPLADLVEHVIRIDDGQYESMLTERAPLPFDPALVHEDDLAGLFYTGGTTGASKGVMLTHRNLVANTWNGQVFQPMKRGDRYLVMAPIFHAAGSAFILQSLCRGVTQIIVPSFDPATVLDLIENERVTHTLGVPTMVAAIVEEQAVRPREVGSLREFSHGGSPIALDVLRRALEVFADVCWIHLYGATETAPSISGLVDEAAVIDDDRAKSAGQPMFGVQLVIRRPDGAAADVGEVGEVTVRGPNVMRGYWKKPEQTASVLRDGWYWTGDVGRVDDEGYLFLLDRSKDMIITGGENVYSTEVEDAIYRHDGVLEATVFGIPDDTWGESVHAVVVPREGAEFTADELIEHCRTLISGYKVPRSVSIQSEPLPKSGAGKVLKRELRAPFWADREGVIV